MSGQDARAPSLAGFAPGVDSVLWYARRPMKRVRVKLPLSPYDVIVGNGALHPRNLRPLLEPGAQGMVVSSRPVMTMHGEALTRVLAGCGFETRRVLLLGDGEKAKTAQSWERATQTMAQAALDRSSFVVAFGGGSIGDAAGFAAATYMRGIRFIQIPTTLLAMVDSSVGGKTGINLADGKNLVGAFHQPSLVLADLSFLRTVPPRERQSGAYEILKCALLRSASLFELMERTGGLQRASDAELERAVAEAVRIKARIVETDEKEAGDRILLNLGHTLGHALEAATSYRAFTHGEAVGYGIEFAIDFGERIGVTPKKVARRMRAALLSLGPRTPLKKTLGGAALKAVRRDKKRSGDQLKEILLEGIGQPAIHALGVTDFARAATAWLDERERTA